MLLTMLVAQGGGLFLGATVPQPKTALAIATIFMLCMMLWCAHARVHFEALHM